MNLLRKRNGINESTAKSIRAMLYAASCATHNLIHLFYALPDSTGICWHSIYILLDTEFIGGASTTIASE